MKLIPRGGLLMVTSIMLLIFSTAIGGTLLIIYQLSSFDFAVLLALLAASILPLTLPTLFFVLGYPRARTWTRVASLFPIALAVPALAGATTEGRFLLALAILLSLSAYGLLRTSRVVALAAFYIRRRQQRERWRRNDRELLHRYQARAIREAKRRVQKQSA